MPSNEIILLLGIILAATSVSAYETLTVLQPNLTQWFPQSQVYAKAALFGLPNFREQVTGQVIWPQPDTNPYGCNPYASFIDPSHPYDPTKLIPLINRGNCSFAQKVKNAQDAGASAVIVVNDDTIWPGSLPFMAQGPDGLVVTIPSMIIYGSSGNILKAHVNGPPSLTVSMSYFLPNPDDRVEVDFYTSATETLSTTFKRQWGAIVPSLGKHALFTPHYQIITGGRGFTCLIPAAVCTPQTLNVWCGNQCTNCGRYCQFDPDLDPYSGASGSDVVIEQARAKCVWKYGNMTGQLNLWFDYVNRHESFCASFGDPNFWNGRCSDGLIAALNIPADFIYNCMGGNQLAYASSAQLQVFDEDLHWQNEYQPITIPQLFVNDQVYHGSLSCPDPVTTTCAPLQMVCAGFEDGTQPITCLTSPGCPIGQVRDVCGQCGGDATTCTTSSGKSFPTGAVVGIIIAALVLIGVGVWFYLRRQRNAMKDDIDQLLKQYLPMSDGPVTATPDRRRVDQRGLLNGDGGESETFDSLERDQSP